jgi:bacterioferritin-associated ferredoxin
VKAEAWQKYITNENTYQLHSHSHLDILLISHSLIARPSSLSAAFASMFVCLCNPVTDSQIRFCATDGCASFREMAAKLGVAQQCGRCAFHAKEVFDHAREVPAAASRRTEPPRAKRPANVAAI